MADLSRTWMIFNKLKNIDPKTELLVVTSKVDLSDITIKVGTIKTIKQIGKFRYNI